MYDYSHFIEDYSSTDDEEGSSRTGSKDSGPAARLPQNDIASPGSSLSFSLT